MVLYALFGTISTALEFGVYSLLCLWSPYEPANFVGFHCGIFCSYLLNLNFNFKTPDKKAKRFLLFYLVQVICLTISSLSLYLLIDIAGLGKIVAKGISILFVALLPYLLNRYITFSDLERLGKRQKNRQVNS